MTPLVQVQNLQKIYGRAKGQRPAVSDVSFDINRGETLALVGESGSGKSTLGRMLLNLEAPTSGDVLYEGRSIFNRSARDLRQWRARAQMIFQDPYSALDPRMTVGEAVAQPFYVHHSQLSDSERTSCVAQLFERVGLDPAMMSRRPAGFSGGQRQRINIARALALSPDFIVADEPITALDVSIQAQIINLLQDIQKETGISLLFISHDLSVVRHLSDRVAIMRAGQLVEIGPTDVVFSDPQHAYTQALLDAVPRLDPAVERFRTLRPLPPLPSQNQALKAREIRSGHWVWEALS